MRNLFRYISDGDTDVLYHNSSMNFYRVYDNDLKKCLREYFLEERVSNKAVEILKSTAEEIQIGIENEKSIQANSNEENSKKHSLYKLVLLVTNNCNFNCKYCYAHGGSYGLPAENMTEIQAKNIIDSFVEKFDAIENIQIFGGEPLLNYKTVKFICEYFKSLKDTGVINYTPNFGIVTNGTCFTPEIVELMKEFSFHITISLDGTSIIHNKLRPDLLGNSTYNKVLENYNSLLNSGIERDVIGFECTYTQEHINNNISIVDLLKFFKQEFSSRMVHITPVSINKDNQLALYNSRELLSKYMKDAVIYTFDEIINEKIINSIPIITGMIDRIINKKQISYICPAGMSNLSVTSDGNISPCFMFTGQKVSVGELDSDINTIMYNLGEFTNKYNTKETDEKCSKCWARYICTGCLGAYGEDLDNKDRTHGFDMMCDTVQTVLETMLIKLAELKSSDSKWNEFEKVING